MSKLYIFCDKSWIHWIFLPHGPIIKKDRRRAEMNTEKKLHIGNSVLRMVLVGISLLFQVGWLLVAVLVEHYTQIIWLQDHQAMV